jgi:Protein of unknown function (DUF3223)
VQRADDKIGPGVESVTVSPHLSIRGVRCFTLLRKDGSVKNFSYRKTLAAMLGDGWEGYQLPELVRLQQLVSAGKQPLCTVVGFVKHIRLPWSLVPHISPHIADDPVVGIHISSEWESMQQCQAVCPPCPHAETCILTSCMGSRVQACRTVQVHFRNAGPEELVSVVVRWITFLCG